MPAAFRSDLILDHDASHPHLLIAGEANQREEPTSESASCTLGPRDLTGLSNHDAHDPRSAIGGNIHLCVALDRPLHVYRISITGITVTNARDIPKGGDDVCRGRQHFGVGQELPLRPAEQACGKR